jgi:hypothetical protein
MANKRIWDFNEMAESPQDDDLLLIASNEDTYRIEFGTLKDGLSEADAIQNALGRANEAYTLASTANATANSALTAPVTTADLDNGAVTHQKLSEDVQRRLTDWQPIDLTWSNIGKYYIGGSGNLVSSSQNAEYALSNTFTLKRGDMIKLTAAAENNTAIRIPHVTLHPFTSGYSFRGDITGSYSSPSFSSRNAFSGNCTWSFSFFICLFFC